MSITLDQPLEVTETECRDLTAAGQLQRMLLPPSPFVWRNWTAAHSYDAAGTVSGDYLDLVPHGDRLFFMLGDVSGKGVVASLLMAQLHAMFRTLIPFELTLDDLMARASRLLCQSSLPQQYATLVLGYLGASGEVVIGNAGHPPPIVVKGSGRHDVRATGVPIGMFCRSEFSSTTVDLEIGDTLLMYTDGLSEARNTDDVEYGAARIEAVAKKVGGLLLPGLVAEVVADQAAFRGGRPNSDDVTVLAIRRSETPDSRLGDSGLATRD